MRGRVLARKSSNYNLNTVTCCDIMKWPTDPFQNFFSCCFAMHGYSGKLILKKGEVVSTKWLIIASREASPSSPSVSDSFRSKSLMQIFIWQKSFTHIYP